MAELNFNAAQVQPEFGYEIIPAGWYNAMIDESEMKPTKDGSGAYLQVRFSIIDGQYANRKVFMRLNLRNSNPVAQEIAFKQLSAIAHAIGVLQVQDSAQLHGIPMKIKVRLKKDSKGEYEDTNEITSVKNINEQVEGGQIATGQMPIAAPQGFSGNEIAMQPQQQPVWQQPSQNSQPWQQPQQQPQQPQQQPTQSQPAPIQQSVQPQSQPAPTTQPTQQAPAQSAMPHWMQQPNQ
jgi:hypothetical protein